MRERVDVMERERAGPKLHDLLLIAVERAAQVQHDSSTLIEQQHTLVAALRETVTTIHRRRDGDKSR
jgi:hypothetical protein